MSSFDQKDFPVRFEWGMPAIEHLAPNADVVIVVDVLSFSTCVEIATNRGATVLPCPWETDHVEVYARDRNAVVAAKRGLEAAYSLSPASLRNIPRGTRLVLPSPNGSSLVVKAKSVGAKIAVGCLRNARAVAEWAALSGKSILVVAAGEKWPDGSLRPALEDLIGAGAILSHLPGPHSPEAEAAVGAFRNATDLAQALRNCASGRELIERGFPTDVELAAELDISACVPILSGDEFVRA